jgi:hypothetical protein
MGFARGSLAISRMSAHRLVIAAAFACFIVLVSLALGSAQRRLVLPLR